MYTNIDGNDLSKEPLPKPRDVILPLMDCNDKYNDDSVWSEGRIVNYCPAWTDQDMMVGGYYGKHYSWYRIILHRCDPTKRNCKSREEQDKYVKINIVGSLF